ncbi:MAG: hypothetical protein KF784_07725 [Fimbriimonadaceae bacterium]|nr:hypothetical protein [Fimbriimonadaceae bacterium]
MTKLGLFAVAIALASVLLAIGGCGSQNCDDLIGTWKIERKPPKVDPNNPFGALAEGFGNMLTEAMTLEIKPENKYTMTLAFFTVEGTAKRSGNTVILTPEKFMGMEINKSKDKDSSALAAKDDAEKPMTLQVGGDKSTLTILLDNGKPDDQAVFKRQTE